MQSVIPNRQSAVHGQGPCRRRVIGFTLIELLVVITIIVVLLALLVPAMDKAIYQAEKLQCATNQRNLVQSCLIYAQDFKRNFPTWRLKGRGWSSAYEIRSFQDDQGNIEPAIRPPLGLGLLPEHGYSPVQQLASLMHCPVMDNSGNPNSSFGSGAMKYAGVGMNIPHDFGYGAGEFGSQDLTVQRSRIIIGYNYRSASYENSGKGPLRMGRVGSRDMILVDMPDQRFTGLSFGQGSITRGVNDADLRAFAHPDGYNRFFADGSGGFQNDSDFDTGWQIFDRSGGWGTMDGIAGAESIQDPTGGGGRDEWIYNHMMPFDESP